MAQIPDTKRLQQLARKFLQGTISDAEQQELDDWFLSQEELRGNKKTIGFSEDEHRNLIFARIKSEIQKTPQQKVHTMWPRIAAAASILLFLSAGVYFMLHKQPVQQTAHNQIHDIVPGGNKAILTLANGKQISLTDAKSGMLAKQGKTAINKTADGEVAYKAAENSSTSEVTYNSINTPRGGKWTVTLPDHSIAWLDASSSIRFPTAFTGHDRTVEITGQVYFEVVHNTAQPFRVKVEGETVEDIGTHFNISAFNDEPGIKTTLVQGAVRVISAIGRNVVLKPGEQSTLSGNQLSVTDVDPEDVLAWKNGMFRFTDEKLDDIMRQLSRWYNVDVTYQSDDLKSLPFNGGIITRFSNVSKVLRMLELTKEVRFKLIQSDKPGVSGKIIVLK